MDPATPAPPTTVRATAPATARASLARATVGLALVGWGLSILVQVTPHEEPWVGVGLVAFGAALLLTAQRLPTLPRISGAWLAGLGLVIVCGIVGFDAWTGQRPNLPKIALVVWGSLLAVTAPIHDARLPAVRPGRPPMRVGDLAIASLPIVGAPMFAWSVQALFKGVAGTTPTEVFIHAALLVPLQAFMSLMGWDPVLDGQKVTYATNLGDLTVDVGAACSGLQAMALFGGVLAIVLFSERPRGRQLALWSIVGLLGVYVANLIRLAVLVVIGHEWGGPALMQAHAQAGWVFFVAWALLFAWLVKNRMTARGPRAVAA